MLSKDPIQVVEEPSKMNEYQVDDTESVTLQPTHDQSEVIVDKPEEVPNEAYSNVSNGTSQSQSQPASVNNNNNTSSVPTGM